MACTFVYSSETYSLLPLSFVIVSLCVPGQPRVLRMRDGGDDSRYSSKYIDIVEDEIDNMDEKELLPHLKELMLEYLPVVRGYLE